ncbi:MAG: hypothetical protein Q9170_003914 [Blastenia crenularia]
MRRLTATYALIDSQIWSQANISDVGVPADFKVEIISDTTIPVLDEELFRAAIHMMYDVSGLPLTYTWLDRDWHSMVGPSSIHLEHSGFGKDASHLSTQYIIWGLNHLMLSMHLSRRFCATTAVLRWKGTQVGAIHVIKRASPGMSQGAQNATDILPIDVADEHIEIDVRYVDSAPIDRQIIFLTAMKAMGEAAEQGLDRPVQHLQTQGVRGVTWKLIGGVQAFSGVLRPRHSRTAVVQSLGSMIEDNKFQSTLVWVKVDGQNTAFGGYSRS